MTDENVQSEQNAENASSPAGGGSAPSQPIAASSPPAKKPRSSTERLIVWGLIGVLLLVAAVEGNAKIGYDWTRKSLKAAIEKDATGETTTVAQLDGLLKGFVTRSDITKEGASYVIECQWKSMFKDYTITITVSDLEPQKANILSYITSDPKPEPVRKSVPAGDDDDDDGIEPTMPMTGGEIAGGPGGAGGGPGGAGGGGGGGGRRPRGMMGQLADEAVQAELKLTDEQQSKIEELPRPDFSGFREMSPEEQTAFREESRQKTESGVKEILDDEQFARVRQLTLRATGIRAVGQSDVQAELKLTEEQQETLGKLLTERSDARRELGFGASPEDRQKFDEEWNEKITKALTDEQKEAWENLLGPPPAEAETTDAEAETTDAKAETTDKKEE